jgi:hypothetical protein
MTAATLAPVLSGRDRAILRAVAAGRAEVTVRTELDILVDGLFCCDQAAAHTLCRAGLICPATAGAACGARVLAVLTPAGVAALQAAGGAR